MARTRPAGSLRDPDDLGIRLRAGYRGLSEAELRTTAVTYLHQLTAGKVVGGLHRLGPLLDCPPRALHAALPLLQHLEALVHRVDLGAGTGEEDRIAFDGIEHLLDAHGLDHPGIRRQVALLKAYGRQRRRVVHELAEVDEEALRVLTHQRCSDVRLLVQVLCDVVGRDAAVALHALDPLLALREIRDDLRPHAADRAFGHVNVLAEYRRLFGEVDGPHRLHREQLRLVEELLARWSRLPRKRARALWPAVFDAPIPRRLRRLPRVLLVRQARARLLASVPEPVLAAPVGAPGR
ncbi:hypothetical protein [Saccharopolyspora sp. CA-218241]|uniref:hypothetical protein n=1 Tax=Saccharopolyspora sp. CA-218241 TaxID=3240027 RepID=UPI003D981BAF